MTPGRRGTGQATKIGHSVPKGSFDFWLKRFEQHDVTFNEAGEKFGEPYLTFLDPDGLKLELTVARTPDPRTPWTTPEVSAAVAIKGFHNLTLTLTNSKGTAELVADVFGHKLAEQHVNRYRFATDAVPGAAIIDLVEAPGEARGHVAGSSRSIISPSACPTMRRKCAFGKRLRRGA